MDSELVKRAVCALKNGSFQQKSKAYLCRRFRGTLKVAKKRFCKFDGDWYHGQTAEGYETTRLQQDWWHDENRVLSRFLALIPNAATVLDVPIGTGRFLPFYHKNRMTVSGLDISHDMIVEARKLRAGLVENCRIDVGDARDLPYADNSFDVIVSFRFLDGHVTFGDLKRVIAEFCRVSRKYLILELGAVPERGVNSDLVLGNLSEDQPVSGRLSEEERAGFLSAFDMEIITSESAYRNAKPFMTVYLCKKKQSVVESKQG